MNRLFGGIYGWSWHSPEKQYNFNGHLVDDGKERALIDPPPMTPEDIEQARRIGPITAIVITNVHHVRETANYRELFQARVYLPVHDRDACGIRGDADYTDGDQLPAGLQAVSIPDNKSPGETALYIPDREKGIWILGDALIGHPGGKLQLMSADKYKDIRRAKAGLRILLTRPFDVVLVGDGASIFTGGKSAVERFLEEES
jgi:glyoxylase-like metal-dependent hydrolase (beta-lactamase superfamily II)